MQRALVVTARLEFGPDARGSAGAFSRFDAPAEPVAEAIEGVVSGSSSRGDRLTPISGSAGAGVPHRAAPPAAPHRPGLSGPVTPRARASSPTPALRRDAAPQKEPQRLIGPYDFAAHRAGLSPLPEKSAPVQTRPGSPSPGHGRNAVMRRGSSFTPHGAYTSADAARWEADAVRRREDFAARFRPPPPLSSPRAVSPAARTSPHYTRENAMALRETAARLRLPPKELAEIIAHETAGSFSPSIWGGKGGRYMGLIQFGPAEREKYGAHPAQSFREQLGAAERFLLDRGFKPGQMGQLDAYSTVLAGRPGLYKARDMNASVEQHVARMRRDRGAQADRFLAAGSGATPSATAGGATPPVAATPSSTARK